MLRPAIAALTLAGILMTSPSDAQQKPPVIIGDATMQQDGTIVVNLRRTADGMHISGLKEYKVGDPNYQSVLSHIGGMKPGETKLVPAWDDPAPDKK